MRLDAPNNCVPFSAHLPRRVDRGRQNGIAAPRTGNHKEPVSEVGRLSFREVVDSCFRGNDG